MGVQKSSPEKVVLEGVIPGTFPSIAPSFAMQITIDLYPFKLNLITQ
ncbi:Uncharacterised protein [Citrobacter koseri]|nr:Uncharacterised protein [Citrobacter koseri]